MQEIDALKVINKLKEQIGELSLQNAIKDVRISDLEAELVLTNKPKKKTTAIPV